MNGEREDEEQLDELFEAVEPLRIDPEGGRWLSQRRARLWGLVLESRYFKNRVERGASGWQVLVLPQDLAAAEEELKTFRAENRFWPPSPPAEKPLLHNTLSAVSILFLLATFYNLTQLDITLAGHHPVEWMELGDAHASLILRGEWWRLITALTLHADALHLLSNLAFGGIFAVLLCRDLGSGLSWILLIASGTLGNLTNAWVQLPSHRAVGSSTAIFGAVGILGAINLMRYRKHLQRRWPLPIAAALSLLALMGTEGKNTDLGGHFFGFLSGAVLGLATEWLVGRLGRPGRGLNILLALASAAWVLFSWWKALSVES